MFILYILTIYVVCLASMLLLYKISLRILYKNALEEKADSDERQIFFNEHKHYQRMEGPRNEDRD